MTEMVRLSASGKQVVDRARKQRVWKRYEEQWWRDALSSEGTLKRFWRQQLIGRDHFENICKVVGVNWEEVKERSEPREMGES
jgi:hypothetical protein